MTEIELIKAIMGGLVGVLIWCVVVAIVFGGYVFLQYLFEWRRRKFWDKQIKKRAMNEQNRK